MVERHDVKRPIVSDVHVNSPGCGFPQMRKAVDGGSNIECAAAVSLSQQLVVHAAVARSPISSPTRTSSGRATAARPEETGNAAGLRCKTVFKFNEGRPNAVDLLKAGSLQLVIYTATGAHSFSDEKAIRRTAVAYRVPCITTLSGAKAAAEGVAARRRDPIRVWSLQEIHERKQTMA